MKVQSCKKMLVIRAKLVLFAGIVMTTHGEFWSSQSGPASYLSRQFVNGEACPAATPLDVVETFSSGDPLTGLLTSNPTKLMEQKQRGACLNEAALVLVNGIRAAFVAGMSSDEIARRRSSKTEVKPLTLGPKYLQLEALNHSVVMSAASNTLNQKIAKMNAVRKCNTFITGETIAVAELPNSATPNLGVNPSVATCIKTWNSSESHRTVLLQDFHQEAVAGIYVDPRNLVWCTITFSARTRSSSGPDCVESKWRLPSPTPSVTPTAMPTVSTSSRPSTSLLASVSASVGVFSPVAPSSSSPKGSMFASPSTGSFQGSSFSKGMKPSMTPVLGSLSISVTLAPNVSIDVPSNVTSHVFQNKEFSYQFTDNTKSSFELKCEDTGCRFCTLKNVDFWCFSDYFSVFFDLYVSKKK